MNYAELMEGFEVVIAVLLEKMSICEFYAGIFMGVDLPLRSTANNFQPQSMPDSALPELYAAIIVFVVKARAYFEAKGMCVAMLYILLSIMSATQNPLLFFYLGVRYHRYCLLPLRGRACDICYCNASNAN